MRKSRLELLLESLISGGYNSLENHDLKQEKVEFKKGNYKTNLYMTFDKTGIPVGCYYETEYIPSETEVKLNDLNLQLKKAVEKEDYLKAADLKKQIDALEKTNN